MVEDLSFVDKPAWNAYHEGKNLQESIEAYRNRHGVYPEAVLADQIYQMTETRLIASFVVSAVEISIARFILNYKMKKR